MIGDIFQNGMFSKERYSMETFFLHNYITSLCAGIRKFTQIKITISKNFPQEAHGGDSSKLWPQAISISREGDKNNK